MKLKAQYEIMEYIFMTVFLIVVIIGLMLFLFWWNFSQFKIEEIKNKDNRIISIARYIMVDPVFVNEDSIFDDAKLTAINMTIKCKELEDILGDGWYLKIKSLDLEGEKYCNWLRYPDCNFWVICKENKDHISQKFPVNIYRKISDKISIGILEVGVY